jgi:polysaccharide pyruvyl transferase WcaK-like protein
VLLSVRAFDSMYVHDNSHFVRSMVKLCQGLLHRGRRPVILLQSRAYGADNDLEVARAITDRVPETALLDPFGAAPLSAWHVAMGALELAERAIAVRYHTAVLSLAAGRIPYHLHYSNKGRDLCDRLQLPGCDLGDFRSERVLAELFDSPSAGFDHQAVRAQVRRDFRRCLERVAPVERG